jgi:hypothetical protein
MNPSIIIWDLETVPHLDRFVAANGSSRRNREAYH